MTKTPLKALSALLMALYVLLLGALPCLCAAEETALLPSCSAFVTDGGDDSADTGDTGAHPEHCSPFCADSSCTRTAAPAERRCAPPLLHSTVAAIPLPDTVSHPVTGKPSGVWRPPMP